MAYRVHSAGEALNVLLRRCVECPDITPSCPSCGSGETCSLIPASCNACASTKCVKLGTLPGQAAPKSGTPVGAIVGGVIAGVAVIIFIVFALWFVCIRPRRRRKAQYVSEKRDQSALSRVGSRTHSIASTVLTRASNVIQIAYIPGVTGRSPPSSPGIPPPMPSLAHRLTTTTSNSSPQVEQHFFMPGDLRDSTWSDASSLDPRMSLGPSLARASVNTTIYRNDAIVSPRPALQGFRGQANVVSVKSGSTSGPSSVSPASTPPVPQIPKGINNSSIVARNVTARPIEVKKNSSGQRVPTLANLARANSKKTEASGSDGSPNAYSDEKEVVFSPTTIIVDSPTTPTMHSKPSHSSMETASASRVSAVLPKEGPLAGKSNTQRPDSGGLTAMIENAIKNASSPRPEAKRHDSGPFSDANEVKESP